MDGMSHGIAWSVASVCVAMILETVGAHAIIRIASNPITLPMTRKERFRIGRDHTPNSDAENYDTGLSLIKRDTLPLSMH
jgi:hypothetical protein